MAGLKQKIQQDLNKALKEKEELKSSVLRLLLASITNREKEKRYKLIKEKPEIEEKDLKKESQLTDEETIEIIFSQIKKGKESILEFKKGKREDLLKKEESEIEILKKYLPEQLSEKEIKKLAKEVIGKVGAKEPKEIGKVMAQLMPKIKGKAEGGLVSKIVKELLASLGRED